MRPIDTIFVHCTATRPDWWKSKTTSQKVKEIKRWHVEDNGWSDIGYHYLIDRSGAVAKGRPIGKVGAHAKGYNTGSIGISLFGGHGSSENDTFDENYTAEQDKALRDLIRELDTKYGPGLDVRGHNEVAAKACPGFQVSSWLNRKPPRGKASSGTIQGGVAGLTGAIGATIPAVSQLDGTAQIIATVFGCVAVLGVLYALYKRNKDWDVRGRR